MIGGFISKSKFATISITGGKCSLNCFYCGSKYISTMEGTMGVEEFEKTVRKLNSRGVRGFLVSGGFDQNGRLPVDEFIPVMRKLKSELGVIFNLHPGLQDRKTIESMRDVVDMVDFEFAYSPGAYSSKGIREPRERYVKVLEDLIEYGPEYIVPHIMLGLPKDSSDYIEEEINEVSKFKPYLLNFLVMIPTPGTPSRMIRIDTSSIIPLIEYGSKVMNGRTSMGCMRPYSIKEDLDRYVVSKGLVQRIANPHHKVVEEFNLKLYDACCSLPEKYLEEFEL
ncbi:radical SAM protein [Metallosphaera hakonensis]|uniref:Radical SAM protein n=1 Tax=Metallosphaera hakonensis JCM 8857 = DSM 7519 TaxID=1293036 RepID=A0A2U9IVX7_9CREN|nr:radical SAM protein [Metallosphaera hakonensis]AWS00155.1 radical SAM protein [Metallosphaera hakonensis JCM 8857 = DSM 7519]